MSGPADFQHVPSWAALGGLSDSSLFSQPTNVRSGSVQVMSVATQDLPEPVSLPERSADWCHRYLMQLAVVNLVEAAGPESRVPCIFGTDRAPPPPPIHVRVSTSKKRKA